MNISDEDKTLFRQSLVGVRRLKDVGRYSQPRPKPRKLTLSIKHEHSAPAHWYNADHEAAEIAPVWASLHFQRQHVSNQQMRQLKLGNFATRCIIDLHGDTESEAEQRLSHWLAHCHHRSDRFALIIHGKGLGSESPHPILKNFVNWWLRNQPRVQAFTSAQPIDGGTGAIYVLLAPDRER